MTSAKIGLLDSALNAPTAGFGDIDLYPNDHQRLGVLCARVVLNRPFIDGNERTGFPLMLEAAAINGIDLEFPDQDDVSDQIEALAAGELPEEEFCECCEHSCRSTSASGGAAAGSRARRR